MSIVSWLSISPDSPVESSSATVRNLFGIIQIVAALVAMTLSRNPHLGHGGEIIYWALVLVQWSILGLWISVLLCLLRFKTQPKID